MNIEKPPRDGGLYTLLQSLLFRLSRPSIVWAKFLPWLCSVGVVGTLDLLLIHFLRMEQAFFS